jgi:hypothetical protein
LIVYALREESTRVEVHNASTLTEGGLEGVDDHILIVDGDIEVLVPILV